VFTTEEEVLLDGHRVHEPGLLEDDVDALGSSVDGVGRIVGLS
jgi:hypothetical protein